MTSRNCARGRPAGANPARLWPSPARSVARLAADAATASLMRTHPSVLAVGKQPRSIHDSGCHGMGNPERSAASIRMPRVRRRTRRAG